MWVDGLERQSRWSHGRCCFNTWSTTPSNILCLHRVYSFNNSRQRPGGMVSFFATRLPSPENSTNYSPTTVGSFVSTSRPRRAEEMGPLTAGTESRNNVVRRKRINDYDIAFPVTALTDINHKFGTCFLVLNVKYAPVFRRWTLNLHLFIPLLNVNLKQTAGWNMASVISMPGMFMLKVATSCESSFLFQFVAYIL